MRKAIILITLAAGLASAASAQELKVKPGNWETTTTMNMSMNMNGQAMNIPPRTVTTPDAVATPEDAASPDELYAGCCEVSNVKSGERNFVVRHGLHRQQGATMNGSMAFELTRLETWHRHDGP